MKRYDVSFSHKGSEKRLTIYSTNRRDANFCFNDYLKDHEIPVVEVDDLKITEVKR